MKNIVWLAMAALSVTVGLAPRPAVAEGISAEVVSVEREARCLLIDWNNDTRKKVCWSADTTFSELDSGEPRSESDLREGLYLRIDGEDGEIFRATEILIWDAASQ
jgi:hypothetical protein